MEQGESSVGLIFQAAWATATRGNPNTSISHQKGGVGGGGGLTLSLYILFWPPPPPSQGTAFSQVQQEEAEDGRRTVENQVDGKWGKRVEREQSTKKKDGNQTDRRAQNNRVWFCSDHKPESGSVLVHKMHLRVPTCVCVCVRVCVCAVAAELLCLSVWKLYGKLSWSPGRETGATGWTKGKLL